jgi:acetyltransferase-like isoleucine patch superfamily enzyme
MSIFSRYRNWKIKKIKTKQLTEWRKKGIVIPDSFLWEDDIRLDLSNPFFDIPGGSIEIGENVKISKGVIIDCFGGKVIIGNNVFIGPYTVIYGHGDVSIGNDTLIGMGCKIISANHAIPTPDKLIRMQPDRIRSIVIKKDVWLGADSKILPGVTLGNGCIVGAASLVTKDLPDYSVSMGSPARVIKLR